MERRVFISSVMDDFAEHRRAARAAVELLRHRPKMAEDFGAKAHSSQFACLDGMRESDVVVLILGGRYGFIAQSGESVTEEEFEFARQRGIPVLVFIQKTSREPQQDAFVNRVSAFEDGYHRASFTTPAELKDEVVRALNDHFGAGAGDTLDSAGAKITLDQLHWGARRERENGTWLGLIIVPTRPRQYISALQLGNKRFWQSIQREAVYGDATIFDSQLGVTVEEKENSTVFLQAADRGLRSSFEVQTDGTLAYGKRISPDQPRTLSLVRNFVIDEDEFRWSLENCFKSAHQLYKLLDDSAMLTAVFVGGSLTGIKQKSFGRIPSAPPNGMSMSMQSVADPFSVPREPYPLSRASLAQGVQAANEITELVARMFRSYGAYYTGEQELR